MDVQFTSAQFY